MSALKPVSCPNCKKRVGRIIVGGAEFWCRRCRARILVMAAGDEVSIARVDRPPRS